MRRHDALTLGERLEVEAALDAAFEPLRHERTDLSALRVRAAVRWGRGAPEQPAALRWSGAISRLSELSVAVGMSALIFVGALGPALDERVIDDAFPPVVDMQLVKEEIREERLAWMEAMRVRLRVLATVPLNDWLDPNVLRPSQRRLDVPTTRTDGPLLSTGPTPY